jgi:hypothetical protein
MMWYSKCHKCGVFMFITHVLILWNGWRDEVEGKCQCMIKNQCNTCPWRIQAYRSPNKVILTPPHVKGIVRIIEVCESRHVGPICRSGCKYKVRLNFDNLGTGLMLNIPLKVIFCLHLFWLKLILIKVNMVTCFWCVCVCGYIHIHRCEVLLLDTCIGMFLLH